MNDKVFVSYWYPDYPFIKELVQFLDKLLVSRGLISAWQDHWRGA
jgi:hypothetical protein